MHPHNKSRPSAENTGTAQNNTDAPIISHCPADSKRFATAVARLTLAGFVCSVEYVIRAHGLPPVICADIDALEAFVRSLGKGGE